MEDITPEPNSDLAPGLQRLLGDSQVLLVEQHARQWLEILLNWEQRNEYAVTGVNNALVGSVVEQARGFGSALARLTLGSHRPFEICVLEPGTNEVMLEFRRPFFFLFSNLEVQSATGRLLGRVERRFGLIAKKYELLNAEDEIFARISSPAWRPWTFPVLTVEGEECARITKKWSGLAREFYTDADNFAIDFGTMDWSLEERAVLFAAAISIDFDFFENNQGRGN